MNKIHMIPIVLGIVLASFAMLPSLIQHNAFATAYGDEASPAGLGQTNMTSGNMTGQGENITSTSPTALK
jgi:hypothetical protein